MRGAIGISIDTDIACLCGRRILLKILDSRHHFTTPGALRQLTPHLEFAVGTFAAFFALHRPSALNFGSDGKTFLRCETLLSAHRILSRMGCGGSSNPEKTRGVASSTLQEVPPSQPSQGRGRILFVFDFDLTIAKKHMWAQHKNTPLDQVVISDATFVDVEEFRNFVRTVTSQGHSVAIATFGRKDVANKAMCYALGDNHGMVISSPADHGAPDGTSLGSKNDQLNALAKRFNVELKAITFFDDDDNNVKEAKRIGVDARHTPSGLTSTVLRKGLPT